MNELPEGIPPVPDGAVYLGKGNKFEVPYARFDGWVLNPSNKWTPWLRKENMNGLSPDLHYAADAYSVIAGANGLSPEVAKSPFHSMGQDYIDVGKLLQDPNATLVDVMEGLKKFGLTLEFRISHDPEDE